MKNPISFYKEQSKFHKEESRKLFKRLSLYSTIRLSVFLLTIIAIYFTFNTWKIAFGVAVFGIIFFLILLSKYTDLKLKRNLHKRLITINEDEITIANREFHDREDGSEFQNPKHYYSLDIDLFGKGSFFQFINRTTIKEGKQTLANLLLENNTSNISQRQNAIKELSHLAEWRQHYSAVSQGVDVKYSASSIISWLVAYQPFLNKSYFRLTVVFSIASLVLFGLSIFTIIPISVLGYWLILGLGITARFLKKINVLAEHTSRAKDTFRQYALLLKEIESTTFSSELLKEQQQKIKTENKKASEIFAKFSKALDALDNRNNIFFAVLGNGYFLSDIRQAYFIEQWISKYSDKVRDWFEVVTFFDAYNSLGNFAFNHQEFFYPNIVSENTAITADDLGHPLLDPTKRIDSNLKLDTEQFFIITGANMAGKSTFLRTVALHIVMANVGLPVCAKKSSYKPIKLITSMRTTDSLTDDSSYFFSELTRLKFIVDTVENDTNYFIILDEILKGTNSTDKAIGSRKFLEKLVNLKATGIIATHDLSLTEIEAELDVVKNYYFDAIIKDDELYFDYKLKDGICQNMNASFLLKKMEIVN